MRTIYWKHTALDNMRTSNIDMTLIAVIDRRTYRVVLHWDRSYAFQSRGSVDVLTGGKFEPVLHVLHHDMTVFADFDSWQPGRQGEYERGGKLPALLREQADRLARLGADIMGASNGD